MINPIERTANESYFRDLFESSPEGILIADSRGVYHDANPKVCEMFGFSKDELLGKSVTDLTPESELAKVTSAMDKLNVIRSSLLDEWLFRRKDGTLFPAEVSARKLDHDRIIGYIRDISERKRNEIRNHFLDEISQVLGESLDFQVTLEKIAQLAIHSFADWCTIDLPTLDGKMKRIALLHRDEIKQKMACEFKLNHPLLHCTPESPTENARRKSLLVKDIDEVWFRNFSEPEERAQLIRQMGLRSYITVPLMARDRFLGTLSFADACNNYSGDDLRLAEEIGRRSALFADNARLYQLSKEAIRNREDILAIVSHDLRNPLSLIQLTTDMISKYIVPKISMKPEERTKMISSLAQIKRSTQRAARLISDLLDFTKIESGELRIETADECVDDILNESWSVMNPFALEKEIQLNYLHDLGIRVHCDRSRILQVLENIIGNAIKFSPPGSEIAVGCKEMNGTHTQFWIKDQGPGIEETATQRIFDRYWQPEETKRQGTGLGLSIAKGIVESHGGKIWVETSVGSGSTFFFHLPLPQAQTSGLRVNSTQFIDSSQAGTSFSESKQIIWSSPKRGPKAV